MALTSEVGELSEIFRWMSEEESKNPSSEVKNKVSEELADIFNFLVMIADQYDIDILKASENKIALNDKKYPIEKSKGSSKKYNEY